MQSYYDRIPLLRESYLNNASVIGSTVRETPQMAIRISNARRNTLENEYMSDRPETGEKEELVRKHSSVLGLKIAKPSSRHTNFSADRFSSLEYNPVSARKGIGPILEEDALEDRAEEGGGGAFESGQPFTVDLRNADWAHRR